MRGLRSPVARLSQSLYRLCVKNMDSEIQQVVTLAICFALASLLLVLLTRFLAFLSIPCMLKRREAKMVVRFPDPRCYGSSLCASTMLVLCDGLSMRSAGHLALLFRWVDNSQVSHSPSFICDHRSCPVIWQGIICYQVRRPIYPRSLPSFPFLDHLHPQHSLVNIIRNTSTDTRDCWYQLV